MPKIFLQFLKQYTSALTDEARETISTAYVSILELGALSYFDRTRALRLKEAFEHLQRDYLPAFRASWHRLASAT